MAKARPPSASNASDKLVDEIRDEIRWLHVSEMITVAVPSHDKNGKPLDGTLRRRWSDKTMKLLADLFEGASALPTTKGIYKSANGRYIWDDTVMVESWAPHGTCSDAAILKKIIQHAQQMRAELDQEAIMVVFDRVMKFIKSGK